MSNPIPLLPCPWCGSDDVETELGGNSDFFVMCNKCFATGPAFDNDGQPKAIAAWNRGPYADRFEIHAKALEAHAQRLKDQASEHLRKAEELLAKVKK